MKSSKQGSQPGGKKDPYAGPMYSEGTKDLDSKKNMGAVHGPKGGKKTTDPLGYVSER